MPKPIPQRGPQSTMPSVHEALALHQHGRLNEAERIYSRILKLRPDDFDALHLLGMLKHQQGKAGEAYRLIVAALAVNPESADALSNLGLVLQRLKREAEALASFDKALAIAPTHIEALNNRGSSLLTSGYPDDAFIHFNKALVLQPGHLEARINRANALCALARWEEALTDYHAVLTAAPSHSGAWFNLGNALRSMGRDVEALSAFDRCLSITPDNTKALNNRGMVLQALNRHHEASLQFEQATTVNKDYADAHFNDALSLLTLGEFRRGLKKYEWRGKRTGMPPPRSFRQPLWLGEYPLQRKTILVHAEQGLGDSIQFARYAKLLAGAGARVFLEVPASLKDLFLQVEGVTGVVGTGEQLPSFDVHCPLASLPLAFHTDLTTIPISIPYLQAPKLQTDKWRTRLERIASPRIALAWAGNPNHPNDRNRSIALARLDPLLAALPGHFISIQRGVPNADIPQLDRVLRHGSLVDHLGEELADFCDTAAILTLVDLVISVDTSVAHLAGAMGRPVWIPLPFSPDWRWMLGREDSPWYPTARLFRQPSPSDWESVIGHLRDELKQVLD